MRVAGEMGEENIHTPRNPSTLTFCSVSTLSFSSSSRIGRVCGKKFVGGVRSRSSGVSSRSFQALLPCFFVPVYVSSRAKLIS